MYFNDKMKYYYAIFKQSKDAVEVEFPDLTDCVTFGRDWDEALEGLRRLAEALQVKR